MYPKWADYIVPDELGEQLPRCTQLYVVSRTRLVGYICFIAEIFRGVIMDDVLIQILSSGGYISINKELIKKYGINIAVIIGQLCADYSYNKNKGTLIEDGYFLSTQAHIEEETSLSNYQQQTCLSVLQSYQVVDIKMLKMPAKRYIKIDAKNLLKFIQLDKESSFTVQQASQKTVQQANQKTATHTNINNTNNIPSTLSKDSIEGIAHPDGGDATHTPQPQSKNNQICYPSGETKKESNGGCFRGKRSLISNPPTPFSEEDLVGKVTNTKTRKKQVQDAMQEQVKKPRVPDKVKMEKYLGCVRTKVFETFNIQDQKKLDLILDWFESIWEKGVRKIDSANFRHCMDDLDKYMKKYSWEKFSDMLETAIVCGLRRLDWVEKNEQQFRKNKENVSEAKYFDKHKDETMDEYAKRKLKEREDARKNFNNIYNFEDVR